MAIGDPQLCRYCGFYWCIGHCQDPEAPLTADDFQSSHHEEPHEAWTRKWVIINSLATIGGAVTGIVALIVAVIALTS